MLPIAYAEHCWLSDDGQVADLPPLSRQGSTHQQAVRGRRPEA